MKLFKKRAEEQTVEQEQDTQEEQILIAHLGADDNLDFKMAMKIPAFSSCISKISNTVSIVPIKLYKRIDENKVEEVKDDIRVKLINRDTGDTLDALQFKKALVEDYFGKGGYAYIKKQGNRVESIHYVDNKEISFRFNEDPIFKEYRILVRGKEYEPYYFLKILRNTKNGREGKSIVDENKDVLMVAYYSLKFEKNLVKSGGNKKGFIKSPKKLTDPAMKALKNAWRKLYSNSSENVVILNDGLDFKESANTSVEMQLNENKRTNSDEICKIFNMPPSLINGGATELDKVDFIQSCINPVLEALEKALDRDLLLEKEKDSYFFKADTSELTKGDIKTRYEAYATASNAGFMQIDEIRYKENQPALGLDFVKLGLQDVLYFPKTGEIYVPNMNAREEIKRKGISEDENRNKE